MLKYMNFRMLYMFIVAAILLFIVVTETKGITLLPEERFNYVTAEKNLLK